MRHKFILQSIQTAVIIILFCICGHAQTQPQTKQTKELEVQEQIILELKRLRESENLSETQIKILQESIAAYERVYNLQTQQISEYKRLIEVKDLVEQNYKKLSDSNKEEVSLARAEVERLSTALEKEKSRNSSKKTLILGVLLFLGGMVAAR